MRLVTVPRETWSRRLRGHAQAGVVAQQADQLVIQGVHSSIPAIWLAILPKG